MPDVLNLQTAKSLARRLKSVPGCPFDEDNVAATAEDMVAWCRGSIQDGKAWSAEDQAVWLVDEVRLQWTQWLGAGQMLKLFRSKFDREKLGPEYQTIDTAAMEREYGKPDPGWSQRLPSAQISADPKERDRRKIVLMKEEAKRLGKQVRDLSHTECVKLMIWAQEQVGIAVTPEQRREVNGDRWVGAPG